MLRLTVPKIFNLYPQRHLSPKLWSRHEIFPGVLEDSVEHHHHNDPCIWTEGKLEMFVMAITFKFIKVSESHSGNWR